jgi:preprotein translocase SecE subunit
MNYKELVNKIVGYLKETRSEAGRVVWPGRQYITAATIVVLAIVFLVAVYILLVDFVFARFFGMFAHTGIR